MRKLIVVGYPPLHIRFRMFLHSRHCTECRLTFWIGETTIWSAKGFAAYHQGHGIRARLYTALAGFSSVRRQLAQQANGVPITEPTAELKAIKAAVLKADRGEARLQ